MSDSKSQPEKSVRQRLKRKEDYKFKCLNNLFVEQYLSWLQKHGSEHEQRDCRRLLIRFDKYLDEMKCDPLNLDDNVLEDWGKSLKVGRDYELYCRSSIRHFFLFLKENNVKAQVPSPMKHGPKPKEYSFFSRIKICCAGFIEEVKPISPSTLRKYKRILRSFDLYLFNHGNPPKITKLLVDSWFSSISMESVYGNSGLIKRFLRYCDSHGVVLENLDDFIKPRESKKIEFHSVLKEELETHLSLRKKTLSENTFKRNVFVLEQLDGYLVEQGFEGGSLSKEILHGWLSTVDDICTDTLNHSISIVNKFLEYHETTGAKVYFLPFRKSEDTYIPYFYSEEEMEEIYRYADDYRELIGSEANLPFIEAEFPMIIRILAGTGMRIGETLALKVSNYDSSMRTFHLTTAKGRKERYVPVSESLGMIIEQYCVAMGISGIPNAFLFPAFDKETHLNSSNVLYRLKKINKAIGIEKQKIKPKEPGACLHSIRHTFVMKTVRRLWAEGKNLDDIWEYISTYLGHSSISDTEKYMKFSCEFMDDELDKFTFFMADVLASEEDDCPKEYEA